MTTPRGRSTRRSSPRRKARPRPSGRQGGFLEHGLPMSLYTDRGAHYFTRQRRREVDRGHPTQVVEPSSNRGAGDFMPSAPFTAGAGRSERAFATLQDRLVNELALAGSTDIAAANAFIGGGYLPAHNARLRHPGGRRRLRFHAHSGRRSRRDPVRRGGAPGRPGQLRLLPDAQAPDPAKPDAAAFRQGAGQGPRLCRRLPRRLPWAALHRSWPTTRNDQRCKKAPLKSAR